MNLNENIHRIKQMMGVINENKIGRMVDEFGIYEAIRYFGGYDNLINMMGYDITRSQKITAIKERVRDINQSFNVDETDGVWIADIGGEQIEYDGLNYGGVKYDFQQIEVLYIDGVIIYGYKDKDSGQDVGSFERDYEELTDDILNEILKIVMK